MIKKTFFFGNPTYLSLKDKQLVIKKLDDLDINGNPKIVTRPIEDIGVIVLENKQITITLGAIDALIQNNCAIITCDSKCMPNGLMLPLESNNIQCERFREQINASIPLKKQLWQQTIRQKILNQAAILEKHTDTTAKCMRVWANDVKSGDSDNLEGRAAAYYWKNLFKIKDFTRQKEGIPPNNLLNYGYAILRAIIARALVSSGLLPTLGIHHHNKYNAYCLADDIMEPYRPYVDEVVINIIKEGFDINNLSLEIKSRLLTIPVLDVVINDKRSPLMIAATQTTASLYKCFSGELRKINYPEM